MTPAKNDSNGRVDRLEESHAALAQAQANLLQAMATLANNQAAFLARTLEIDARMAETNRINAERFARIEAILLEHSRILRALPEAIREKIGFKNPPPQSAGSEIRGFRAIDVIEEQSAASTQIRQQITNLLIGQHIHQPIRHDRSRQRPAFRNAARVQLE